MGNLVKYGSYEIDEARREKEELEAGGGADFMKLKVGRNVVRFLPPPVGKRTPFRVIYQHFITLPGATGPVSFVCPKMEKKGPCPACQRAEEMRNSGNPADADLASDLFARRRVFANVIDRGEPEKGPRILAFGKTVHEQLVAMRDDEDAGGDYTNPEDGFDVIIKRVGTGKNDTKYSVSPARENTPLAKTAEQMQEWIDAQHNLENYARVDSPEDLRKKMGGEPSDGAPRTAATGRSRPSNGTRPQRRRSAEDDAIETDGEEVQE